MHSTHDGLFQIENRKWWHRPLFFGAAIAVSPLLFLIWFSAVLMERRDRKKAR